jgi:mycoredoxin-dependent peroxiredoxin
MKKQMSVWVVSTALMLSIGVVYSLSTNPRLGSQSASVLTPDVVGGAAQAASPASAESPPSSLTPNLSQTDAYEFLDPIPVGHAAPDFMGKTADGKNVRLSSLKGHKNAVLVFYQGSFCTVCGAQLTDLQNHVSEFKKQEAEIIAISADDNAHALQSVGEHGLTFSVVPDTNKAIIKKYGVSNVSKQGLAWPSLFVVDKKGQIRLSYADRDGHRLHSDEILPVLSKINGKPVTLK